MATRTKTTVDNQLAEIFQVAREQTLQAVKQNQMLALDATAAWADLFGRMSPQFQEIPANVPDFAEVLSESFGLTKELAAAQSNFASSVLSALSTAATVAS
jgi:hypothetical protein